ncbi:MAG: CvpA family protein [Bacteroidales bacterium]|jgi:membrane protein required for colicin V production
MNWIDFGILIVLGLALIRGFSNGFVKEIASLLALILGIWGAIKFSGYTEVKLDEWFRINGQYTGIISFIVTFGIIVVIVHFIGVLADKLVSAISLEFLNRILGMAFGVLKAILLLSVVFLILNTFDAHRQFLPRDKIAGSKFYNPISDIAPAIFPIIRKEKIEPVPGKLKKNPSDSSV